MDSFALEAYCLSLIEGCPLLNKEGFEKGKAWVYTTLAAARSGSKTLFDEVIELIESVPARASWNHKITLHIK
ncbi:hypothetical protein O5O45_15735 [Hahella aquimaris]|uniref:hypothetical protein n=1 Tax=Hahella sp. HNIBRBA332 TaxID=3015983 RepID=UPI00273CBBC0|nr:hypothetical protein [Hahella sp. HNIBRBA332]WLQ17364.1 hypothetical protein O5O45_15735 [Hahella sp. HNIBRBA332]